MISSIHNSTTILVGGGEIFDRNNTSWEERYLLVKHGMFMKVSTAKQ